MWPYVVVEGERPVVLYSLAFAAAACLALLLALSLPLATTVFRLILFGLLHNFFELRYVLGRFGALLERPRLEALLAAITGIAAIRRPRWVSGPPPRDRRSLWPVGAGAGLGAGSTTTPALGMPARGGGRCRALARSDHVPLRRAHAPPQHRPAVLPVGMGSGRQQRRRPRSIPGPAPRLGRGYSSVDPPGRVRRTAHTGSDAGRATGRRCRGGGCAVYAASLG